MTKFRFVCYFFVGKTAVGYCYPSSSSKLAPTKLSWVRSIGP